MSIVEPFVGTAETFPGYILRVRFPIRLQNPMWRRYPKWEREAEHYGVKRKSA